MSNAAETPILDLLRSVPSDARMIYEHSPIESQSIPVGPLAAKAVATIERLTAEHNAQKSVLVNEWFIAGQQFRRDIARLTAEVAALREDAERVRADISALHMAQATNNQNHPAAWHDAVDAALEAIDAARKEQP